MPDVAGSDQQGQSAAKRARNLAIATALVCCLTAGSVQLLPLYAPLFQTKLSLSQTQLNGIIIAASVGLYAPVPCFGIIADTVGPKPLSLLAGVVFAVGYLVAAYDYTHGRLLGLMIFAFVLVGMGTSASYFGALVTSAKAAGPKRRGLGLALPIAAYGLSPFWLAQAASLPIFHSKSSDELDIVRLFGTLAVLLLAIGIIGGLFLQRNIAPESLAASASAILPTEESPLLEDTQSKASLEEEEHNHRPFFSDWSTYVFATGLFMLLGASEMYNNNLGTLLLTLPTPPSCTLHISLLSLSSTTARLVSGYISDFYSPQLPILLISSAIVSPLAFLAIAYLPLDTINTWMPLFSICIGASYGAVFTLTPNMVSKVWGITWFGRNWGVLTWCSALGTIAYSSAYARFYDAHATKLATHEGMCIGKGCFQTTFAIAGWSGGLAVCIWIFVWQLGWRRKGWI